MRKSTPCTPRPPPDQHRFDAADRRALATSRPLERIAVEASLLPARSVRRHHAKAARHASTLAQIVQLPADCIALWLLGSRRTLLCSSPLLAWSRGFCFSFPRCHVVHFYCTTLFGRHLSTVGSTEYSERRLDARGAGTPLHLSYHLGDCTGRDLIAGIGMNRVIRFCAHALTSGITRNVPS